MDDFCYAIVGNIPSELRSADLRAFFSQFIETNGFACFHYRHRPEIQRNVNETIEQNEKNEQKTCCCVVKVYRNKIDELIRLYNRQNWTNSSNKLYSNKALISRIKMSNNTQVDKANKSYLSKKELQHTPRVVEEFIESDVQNLIEMKPPAIMPNGNVGTPLTTFIELIRTCKFPPHLIKKLGLTFPRSKKRKYGNVPFDYDILGSDLKRDFSGSKNHCYSIKGNEKISKIVENEKSDDEHVTEDNKDGECKIDNETSTKLTKRSKNDSSTAKNPLDKAKESQNTSNIYKNSDSDSSSDNETEEWDRHGSLHNDITSQERTKERLYEEDIELKWEKGGSGLVWYTDAAFWKKQEEADFDEETVDDWDVDMEIYEEPGAGDLDAKTMLQLRVEKEWKHGKNIDLNRVGGFEKYTRGFGGHLMRKQGWKEGSSLGSSQVGITEPIPNDGQTPLNKRGLGYYGEKLNRNIKRARPTREAVISTVFDEQTEGESELFQSDGPYNIKYRDKVEFVSGTGS